MYFSSDSEEECDLESTAGGEGEASGASSIGGSDSGSSSDSDARDEESDYEDENKSCFSNGEVARGKSVKKQARAKTSKTIEVRQAGAGVSRRCCSRSNSVDAGDLPEEKSTGAHPSQTRHVSKCRLHNIFAS